MDPSRPSHSKGKRAGPQGKSTSLRDKPEPLGQDTYLVSLASKDDARPFGSMRGKEMIPNEYGKALAACWRGLARLRPGLRPDAVRIGARHVQGILILPPEGPDAPSLSEAIRLFKVLSSLRLSQIAKVSGRPGSARVRNKTVTEAFMLPAGSPSALWKKGYSERRVSGAVDLAEARKALKT